MPLDSFSQAVNFEGSRPMCLHNAQIINPEVEIEDEETIDIETARKMTLKAVQSLKVTAPRNISAKEYYGIWGDDGMTDDEFVGELKSLRSFNRDLIDL